MHFNDIVMHQLYVYSVPTRCNVYSNLKHEILSRKKYKFYFHMKPTFAS